MSNTMLKALLTFSIILNIISAVTTSKWKSVYYEQVKKTVKLMKDCSLE